MNIKTATSIVLHAKVVQGPLQVFARHSTVIAGLSLAAFILAYCGYGIFVPEATADDSLMFAAPILMVALPASVIVAVRNIYEIRTGKQV